MNLVRLAEQRRIPDCLIRMAIRRKHAATLRRCARPDTAQELEDKMAFISAMDAAPIALSTDKANRQHYAVPPELFKLMLGPHLKYSSCLWPKDQAQSASGLGQAEERMLELMLERARLEDGQTVLELGCGWGSFSLWLAAKHPNSKITAVSNSGPQIGFIQQAASERGLSNLTAIRADMNIFSPQCTFDRLVSVEMFEHMRNWLALLERISQWLVPGGLAFVHVFAHRRYAYAFDDTPNNWMARHFFADGIMPSDDLMLYFQDHMDVVGHWRVNGQHYCRTLEAWLQKLDANRSKALDVLKAADTPEGPEVALQRWRMFLMACAELFAWRNGNSWFVSHYLLRNRGGAVSNA